MVDEKTEAMLEEINKLDDSAKILFKSSLTVFQNRLLEVVNFTEEIKQGIKLEEKDNGKKTKKAKI